MSPLRRFRSRVPARFLRDVRGSATVQNVLWLLLLIGLGGVAVDTTNAYRMKTMLQATADAAALAAAHDLPDADLARETALAYVEANMPSAVHGAVVREADVQIGAWNAATGAFEIDESAGEAVRVVLGRDGERGAMLGALMLRMFGHDGFRVSAGAVALRAAGAASAPCFEGGFFTAGRVESNTNNRYAPGFCLHGEAGVTMNANNEFQPGSGLSMANAATLVQGANNRGVNEALVERSHELTLAPRVAELIAAARAGEGLPDWIDGAAQSVSRMPRTPARGALYLVNGAVTVRSNTVIEDVAIIATGAITVAANTELRNVVLMSDSHVTFNSNIEIGDDSFCDGGTYSVYIFAGGNVTLNSNVTLRALQIAAGGWLTMNSNNDTARGVIAEAMSGIVYNSNLDFGGCGEALESPFAPPPEAERVASVLRR